MSHNPDHFRFTSAINQYLLTLSVLASLVISGCGSENGGGTNPQYSTIKGIVTEDSGSYSPHRDFGKAHQKEIRSLVRGATVVAMATSLGPTLEPISDTTETDANGNFSLACWNTGIRDVIVAASKGDMLWEAVVASTLNPGGIEYCRPLTMQSTVAARVYALLAAGPATGSAIYPDVAEVVSTQVAAAVSNSQPGITQLAGAIQAGENAWSPAFLSPSVGNGRLAWTNAVQTARITAEESLESSLSTAGENSTLAAAAFSDYLLTDENTYVIEGVNRAAVAEIDAICSRAEVNAMTGSDPVLRLAVAKQTAFVTAFMISDAVDSSMRALLAPQSQLDSASVAGANLVDRIGASTTPIGIDSAFTLYHAVIIQLASETAGRLGASGVVSTDSLINAKGGLRATFLATATLQLSSTELVQLYASFFEGVETDVSAGIGSLPGVQVNSLAAILILTNMTGETDGPQ